MSLLSNRRRRPLAFLFLLSLVTACTGGPSAIPPPALAPSVAPPPGLTPAPPGQLCDSREVIVRQHGARIKHTPWGNGEELILGPTQENPQTTYHLFFDDRARLVGYVGVLPQGLDLASQPEYGAWLTKQKATDFLLPTEVAKRLGSANSGRLYTEQAERINTRGIVISRHGRQILYVYSAVLAPYASLLSPYQPEYLDRIQAPVEKIVAPGAAASDKSESADYKARQQFAKGEVAQFTLCGAREAEVAIDAYRRAIDIGLVDTLYQAEAYHRLGLAYRDKGEFPEAAAAIEASLKIRPSIPEVVNHLGKVYALMGNTARAVEAFHTAIGLKPNYAIAHFNLAETVEPLDPRRALTAYENYLAYVDRTPGEQERIAKAKERVRTLRK
jgi:tetratricopeptide (TPR) repeat protein